MCEEFHEISVSNLSSNEIITYELLFIKGYVTKKCNCDNVLIKNEKTGKTESFSISKAGDFKAILQLSLGSQTLDINYCNSSKKYEFIYKEPETLYRIQPIYLICDGHDGSFKAPDGCHDLNEACDRITLGVKLIQCLYAEKIAENDLGRKTFCLRDKCVPFYCKLSVEKARNLDERSLWIEFGNEILNSDLGVDEKLKFVAFIGCTLYEGINTDDFSYENIKRHTKANAALGSGGLALFGSGCLYTWPSSIDEVISRFENNSKIDLANFLDDSNYRRTIAGCYATTIGAVCHEIGHIFDLGHTKEGIMGYDFDYVNRMFTIDNITENLPDRLVQTENITPKDKRLTQIKKSTRFLEKYHNQKYLGGVFFTRNCACILSCHKWLNQSRVGDTPISIVLDKDANKIISDIPIRIIEIRDKQNGYVINFLEYPVLKKVKTATLPIKVDYTKYCVFLITIDGHCQLFY